MGVAILRNILYNTCMNKLSGMSIVMDIEDLAGSNLKLDKAANHCAARLSDVGGGGLNSAFCKLFAIFLLLHHAVRFPVIPQRIASRGTSEARDEQQSTETVSFRCCCERCRLSRAIFERNTPQSLPCGISKHKLNTCDKTYKPNKGGLINRIIVQCKSIRRIV